METEDRRETNVRIELCGKIRVNLELEDGETFGKFSLGERGHASEQSSVRRFNC